MNMNITQKLEGFYSLKVHGGKRGEIDFGTHKNMILDAGITHMLSDKYPLEYIHVGSGSSQPNPAQVQLDAKFAHTYRNKNITRGYVSEDDSEDGKAYGYDRLTVQFDKGAAKGNIAELGVGNNTQGNPLWSRSLVLDKSGNQTTITVLDDEFLTVTYEVRRYVNTETVTTTLQYDDDGEMKSVECSVEASDNTTVNGWASAGLVAGEHYLKSHTDETSKTKLRTVSAKSGLVEYKMSIGKFNDIDIERARLVNTTGGRGGVIPYYTYITFNPPLHKTNEFELTIGVTVTIERA